jgi:hypothetical protein
LPAAADWRSGDSTLIASLAANDAAHRPERLFRFATDNDRARIQGMQVFA